MPDATLPLVTAGASGAAAAVSIPKADGTLDRCALARARHRTLRKADVGRHVDRDLVRPRHAIGEELELAVRWHKANHSVALPPLAVGLRVRRGATNGVGDAWEPRHTTHGPIAARRTQTCSAASSMMCGVVKVSVRRGMRESMQLHRASP
jgi:hypothetical protein